MNKEKVQELITQLIKEIEGIDQTSDLRPATKDTPKRVANAYNEIFDGYRTTLDEEIKIFKADYSEIIVSKDIKFYSMCEHHVLPFFGTVDIIYIEATIYSISIACYHIPEDNIFSFIFFR